MLEFLREYGPLFGIITTIIAPLIWFVKRQSDRNERLTNQMIDKIQKGAENNHNQLRGDLIEFRKSFKQDINDSKENFETNIDKIHEVIDERDKDMKLYINSNINDVKAFIADIEFKIDETKNANHEVEKHLLAFKTEVSKDYVSHQYLDKIINNNNNTPKE